MSLGRGASVQGAGAFHGSRACVNDEVHLFPHSPGEKPTNSLCGRIAYPGAAGTAAVTEHEHRPICFDCWRDAGWRP